MTLEDRIHRSMLRMLVERDVDAVEVTDWEEEFIKAWNNGCTTCGYGGAEDKYEVHIYYTDSSGKTWNNWTYDGKFGDLIQNLTDEDDD